MLRPPESKSSHAALNKLNGWLNYPWPSTLRADPHEEAAQAHSVLFGIIQADRIPESFVVEDGEPKHGFFVDDVLNLWAEDGTNRKLQVHGECPDLCIEVGHPVRLTYRRTPFPHMLGQLTNAVGDTCFAIDFNSAIPMDEYRPCVVFPGTGSGHLWRPLK